jgi:hypothetical protein
MNDWANFASLLMVPLGGLLLGFWALWLNRRDERRWAEEKRHHQSPAE